LPTIWHPFTQHALADPPLRISAAQGAWLHTHDGRRVLDAISSWWVNTHGHNHPRIVAAVQAQAARLDQIIFAGFTHDPAEALAEKLAQLLPAGLSHVFFSDSGSVAVEVGLKMAVGAWQHRGQPRKRVLAFEHAYHGDTFAAMALGARGGFNDAYRDFLFDVTRLPFPDGTLKALQHELTQDPHGFAAIIFEPLVLGAGGMLMYDKALLQDIAALCQQHEIPLIADEVMTGWGRTGTLLACEQADIVPDILCLSKGLTGGFLPLAVTLCRQEIYDAFYQPDRRKMFFHSSSYTANPLACAAAVANLEIWQEESVRARIAALSNWQAAQLRDLENHPDLTNLRQTGTITAFDLITSGEGYFVEIGPRILRECLAKNILIRPLGNTIYLMPPYCITEDELAEAYATLRFVLGKLNSSAAGV
jgi:adenosylmethionine---8-amino-7-oxononanoate aminotransferase